MAAIADEGIFVSSPPNLPVATRDWTAAELAAAKPYPLPELASNGEAPSADLLGGPTGAPGSKPGYNPDETLSLPSLEDLAGAPMGYGYPAPFTVIKVKDISNLTKFPFSTVGVLFFKQGGSSYRCSASVYGPNAIVTAGHCGSDGAGNWSTNMVFIPQYANGAAPKGQWTGTVITTFVAWFDNADLSRDWSIMQIKKKLGVSIGTKVGYLGYAWNWGAEQHWWEIGYPSAAPYDGKWMYSCQASFAYYSPFGLTAPAPVGVGCNQTPGCSGGPWVLFFGSGNYVNSVFSHYQTNQPLVLFGPYADSTVAALLDIGRAW